MSQRVVLEAGAALGAASLLLSGCSLLATHAPSLPKVAGSAPGTDTAAQLRLAELATGGTVIAAGAAAAVLMRQAWPLLLAVTTVGAAVAVYEALLHYRGGADRELAR